MFSKKLTFLREQKGLTIDELADELNCASNRISDLEQNKKNPTVLDIEKFADFFNVSTDYLLSATTYSPSIAKTIGWKDYIQLYWSSHFRKFEFTPNTTMIPESYALNEELLPYALNCRYGYGGRFNSFLVEDDFEYYHKKDCPCLINKNSELIHRYIAIQDFSPCPICNPPSNIHNWYVTFLKKNFGDNIVQSEIKLYANAIEKSY